MAKIKECFDIDIEKQYQQYLKLTGQDESNMHPEQRVEVKQAFYGGIARILFLTKYVIPTKTQFNQEKDLENLWLQMNAYWQQRMQQPKSN